MAVWRHLLVLLLLVPGAFAQAPDRAYRNLAALDAVKPGQATPIVTVLGFSSPGDWGPPKTFRYDATNALATNAIRRATLLGTGRWIHDWDGDVRAFGAVPYQARHTAVPWGFRSTNSAIGTGAFSVWVRTTFPTSYVQAASMFAVNRVARTNVLTELASGFSHRASPDVWGFLFRSTTGGSSAGTVTDDAAVLDTTPSAISAYAGQTVNVVVTRSGTNAAVFFNGTNVTSLFTFSNPAGWAKSLALGEQIAPLASCNENSWYWPKPIFRFAIWGSALNSVQAADPESVGSKLVDFTPESTAEPIDATDAFNAAGEYAAINGGGLVQIPPGAFRVDGEIKIRQNVTWKGSGASPYPAAFRTGFRPGTTWLAPWFGSTNRVFVGDQTQSGEVLLYARELQTLGNGFVSSRWLRSSIRDLVLFGAFSRASDGITLDRVGAVGIQNVSFWFLPGYAINGYAVNSVQILDCEGPVGKGVHLRGAADVTMMGNFIDGPKGPALWFAGNLCRIVGNVFEIAGNPLSGYPPYAWAGTANTNTDSISITHTAGHRLRTGHPIRFDPSSGTLPSPLTTNVDYYAVVDSDSVIRVATNYVDEISSGGAVNRSGILDLTTAGSGTWYLTVGPSVGMIVNGDHNTVASNQGQRNYDGGLIAEGSGNNSFVGNIWINNGDGNTNAPAVRMIGTSRNVFIGNQIDDRESSGQSQLGFVADATSLDNTFIGNSWNIDSPYTFADPDRQLVIDANRSLFSWNGTVGNLYVPSRAGFTAWDPADAIDSAATVYDRSARRWYVASGTTSSASDWNYGVTYPFAGPIYWSGSSGGTMSGVNNGAGTTLLSLNGTAANSLAYMQANDASSATAGPTLGLYRNYGADSTTYGTIPTFTELGEIILGGWATNDAGGVRNAASIDAYSDAAPWNLTNHHSQINFKATPPTKTSRQSALTLSYPTSSTTNDTPLVLSTFNGTDWVAVSKRVKLGTNGSAPGGGRVLYVDP